MYFFHMFLEKYMPQHLRDHLRDQFLWLEEGSMTVVEYKDHFHDFVRHSNSSLTTKYERVHFLIWGLRLPLCMYS